MSEDKPTDYKKRLSLELTNSLFREDQNFWDGGDIGMGPDLQVKIIIMKLTEIASEIIEKLLFWVFGSLIIFFLH